ncbi:phosphatidylinositol 3-kinase catalytic subunit type 3 [Anaeramoeba flamelloides]|uniref:Phosphatidylinositol 3-kinase catalytic subunit type 3 n=1 Tax=Anaeramoeba flamelloides TaxID=1746091 RepID=A0ABQ8X9S9_9EUKA|nr:phosphatidylinositol 3-kinase catalytic subunit type 3 [Anaeramoeba flamelloides]
MTTKNTQRKFSFILHNSLKIPFQVLISKFEGNWEISHYEEELLNDPYLPYTYTHLKNKCIFRMVGQLFSNGLAISDSVECCALNQERPREWNQVMKFSLNIKDLPLDTILILTIFALYSPKSIIVVGGTSINIFDQNRILREGSYRLKLNRNKFGNYNEMESYYLKDFPNVNNNTNKKYDHNQKFKEELNTINLKTNYKSSSELDPELVRLNSSQRKYFRKFSNKKINKTQYIDDLVFKEIKRLEDCDLERNNRLLLTIRFPEFKKKTISYPIIYQDKIYKSKYKLDLTKNLNDNLNKFNEENFQNHYNKMRKKNLEKKKQKKQKNKKKKESDENYMLNFEKEKKKSKEKKKNQKSKAKSKTKQETRRFFTVCDPEIDLADIIEAKNRKLTRNLTGNYLSVNDMKPSIQERRDLSSLIEMPPTYVLTEQNKTLLWQYRFHLIKDKRGLAKFLKSVDFSGLYEEEEEHVKDLMRQWDPLNIDHVLECLTINIPSVAIRDLLVKQLSRFNDDQIILYLLQLVQSIRQERAPRSASLTQFLIRRGTENLKVGNYLFWYLYVEKSDDDFGTIYTRIYKDFKNKLKENNKFNVFDQQLSFVGSLKELHLHLSKTGMDRPKMIKTARNFLSPNGKFKRLNSFTPIILPLDPDIIIKGIQNEKTHIYKSSLMPFGLKLKIDNETDFDYGVPKLETNSKPLNFSSSTTTTSPTTSPSSSFSQQKSPIDLQLSNHKEMNKDKKKEGRKGNGYDLGNSNNDKDDESNDGDNNNNDDDDDDNDDDDDDENGNDDYDNSQDKNEEENNNNEEENFNEKETEKKNKKNNQSLFSSLFTSTTFLNEEKKKHKNKKLHNNSNNNNNNNNKLLIVNNSKKKIKKKLKRKINISETINSSIRNIKNKNRLEYGILFKVGDDMRQDQLIIQMINLMDQILKKENLDLELTPYKVLALSREVGMIEMVIDSTPISKILKNGTIQEFFRQHNPSTSTNDRDKIKKSVIQSYVKSCAGYSVITYILGIGDRHLDNLLLLKDGHLFHIDFGFILGNDPKLYPPPFKLSKEIVEGMGGMDSNEYHDFKSYCCEAFNILRKSANLILCLFSLMLDANLPDLNKEKEKALIKIQEKYKLELSDEQAIDYFQELINTSVNALFPKIVDKIHGISNAMKK